MDYYSAYQKKPLISSASPWDIDLTQSNMGSATRVHISCDGPGDIDVYLATEQGVWGDAIRLCPTEAIVLNVFCKYIRVSHTGLDAGVRLVCTTG